MNRIIKKSDKKAAFTIIELLTVMSIIVILIALLVPALNKARRYAKRVRQKAQLHSIGAAIELFNAENEGFPPSEEEDITGVRYCGAMKLAEAIMGQDLLGFHPASRFRSDGTVDGPGTELYTEVTKHGRVGPYLQHENANAYRLNNLYQDVALDAFNEDRFVLCDVYSNVTNLDSTIGAKYKIWMPILYFRANTSNAAHDYTTPALSIYNYLDNDDLVTLGIPWMPGVAHPMSSGSSGPVNTRYDSGGVPIPATPGVFYEHIRNENIALPRPYRSYSYILLSAGFDGEYGTRDDVYNFEKQLVDFAEGFALLLYP